MKKGYEAMLILDPQLDEDNQNQLITRFSENVTSNGGEIENVERLGRKKMAYKIQKKPDGYYVLAHFQALPNSLDDLNRICRITEGIMRHLIIRRDEA